VSLPVNFAGRQLADARLQIVEPAGDHPPIPLKFNPSEYRLVKENTFAEIPIPGLESPPLQYVRGGAETLSMDLLVDTSDDLRDVRTAYVDGLRSLLDKNEKLHAPPIVDFIWAGHVFHGVLQSLEVTYTLFNTDGTPLRAKLAVKLKQHRPVAAQVRERQLTSPDVDKTYVVRLGERLDSISAAVYRDPALWREIARANAITDPRALTVGTVLTIPALTESRA
jgi:hypothetical protein